MSDRKLATHMSRWLLILGTVLATVSVAMWTLDAMPQMPEWMLRLAVYKLTLGSGAALMIAGAVLRRTLREAPRLPVRAAQSEIGAGTASPIPSSRHHKERAAARGDR